MNHLNFIVNPITQEKDFEGYNVYMTRLGFDVAESALDLDYVKVGQYDLPNNGFSFETVPRSESEN